MARAESSATPASRCKSVRVTPDLVEPYIAVRAGPLRRRSTIEETEACVIVKDRAGQSASAVQVRFNAEQA
jgi:hypothetical protein